MQKYGMFSAHHLCLLASILFHVTLCAQTPSRNIQITFRKNLLEKTNLRGLIFSDEAGQVEAFYQLDEEAMTDQEFSISVAGNKKINLTLLEHYTGNNPVLDQQTAVLTTILDIQDGQVMDVPEDYGWSRKRESDLETVRMTIHGCWSLEDLIVDRKRTGLFFQHGFKQNKEEVRLKYDKEPGEDIFILIRANGEAFYRYFYLEDGELVPPEVQFETLDSDLTTYRIKAPVTGNWKGYISKKNEFTGTECVLYAAPESYPEANEFILYVPEDRITGSYYLELSTVGIHGALPEYHIVHGLYGEAPADLSLEAPWAAARVLSPSEIALSIYQKSDIFSLRLVSNLFDMYLNKERQRNINWSLIGYDQTEVSFQTIQFTPEIFAAFPMLNEVSFDFSNDGAGTIYQLRHTLPEADRQNTFFLLSPTWQAKNMLNARRFNFEKE